MTKQTEQGEINETPAQDSVKMHTVSTADIVKKMQGASKDDWTKLQDVLDQIGHEADSLPKGANKANNEKSVSMHAVKEDLKTIFAGKEDLTEEFIDDISTLFEAAVSLRVSVIEEEIVADAEKFIEESLEEQAEEILENISGYLDETVNEWLEENELAIESGIKSIQQESFMAGLKNLYLEHAVDIPEDQLDIVESLDEEVNELKAKLNEVINKNIELESIITEARLDMAFEEVSEGLAATQVENLKTLTENLDFKTIDEYKEKVRLVKESHFGGNKPEVKNVIEEGIGVDIQEDQPKTPVSSYAAAISKQVKNKGRI